MIIEEIEKKVAENQIGFDFLDEPQIQPAHDSFEWVGQDTLVILMKTENEISANFDLCGKTLLQWVSLAASGCKQKIVDSPCEEDFLQVVKNVVQQQCDQEDNFQFVAVLYSDTPLLKKSTFLEIMSHFSKNRMNVLRLSRGYVFRAEYLKNTLMLLSTAVEPFDVQDFTIVDTTQKVSYAFGVLNERILNYHKQNGVVLLGENTIFVDADVEIESGAVIYPNNTIKGQSFVGHNAILESGNFVLDTIICEEAFVCQSYFENSKVEKGKIVGPFAKLINQKV